MMQPNNINGFLSWQCILTNAQALSAILPEIGINPDELALLPLSGSLGLAAFLKRECAEREG